MPLGRGPLGRHAGRYEFEFSGGRPTPAQTAGLEVFAAKSSVGTRRGLLHPEQIE